MTYSIPESSELVHSDPCQAIFNINQARREGRATPEMWLHEAQAHALIGQYACAQECLIEAVCVQDQIRPELWEKTEQLVNHYLSQLENRRNSPC